MKHALKIVTVLAMFTGATQIASAADGQAIYEKTCKICHDKGLMGSPKTGDKEKWAPLIKGGQAALEESVAKGKGKMKAYSALTAEEIKASVAYIISKSK